MIEEFAPKLFSVLVNGFASGAGAVTPNTAAPNLITVTIQQ
jgi:hypothetical protein